jgi:hypothetical protein
MRHRIAGPNLPAVVVLAVALAAAGADAASRARTATANVTVSSLAKLSMGAMSIAFADADPDTVPVITASAVTITAKARTTPGTEVTLSVRATADLASGSATIPATAVTWTGGGTGFIGGTMSAALAQRVASWIGSGVRSGSQTYALANSWTYATGNYTTSFTYTLTAP